MMRQLCTTTVIALARPVVKKYVVKKYIVKYNFARTQASLTCPSR